MGDAQNLRDRRFRDRVRQEALTLRFPARELGRPEGPFRPPQQPALSAGRGQALFGALGNQIPFNLREEPKQRYHDLGLEIGRTVESNVLLDSHELHPLLEEAVHQLDDLPHTPAQTRELADQEEVTWLDLFQHGVHAPPSSRVV